MTRHSDKIVQYFWGSSDNSNKSAVDWSKIAREATRSLDKY